MSKEVLLGNSPVVVSPVEDITTGKGDDAVTKKVIKVTVDEKAYVESLPEGVTLEMVQMVNKANSSYLQKLAQSSSEVVGDLLKENKEAQEVHITAPYLGDSLTTRSSRVDMIGYREKQVRIPGSDGQIVTTPAMSVKVINKNELIGASLGKMLKQTLQDKLA